jgi:hypothetical protein
MSKQVKLINIDPKMFISPPYIKCPKCGKNSFGILSIYDKHYSRRCNECFYPKGTEPDALYDLPPLNKKVIYLDQFAISNIMKAINKKLGKSSKVDSFFLDLFLKIEQLTKQELIICPDSTFHRQESQLTKYYKSLKRMYEQFSDGVTFYDPETIRRFQICLGFKCSIEDKALEKVEVDSIIYGNRNAWKDKYIISVEYDINQEEIEKARAFREQIHENIKFLFSRWKKESNKKFADWFKEEASAYGSLMVNNYINRLLKLANGQQNPDEFISLAMGEENILMVSLQDYLSDDVSQENKLSKIFSFLTSKEIRELPYIKISAGMWATLAHNAAHGGRKEPPNIGMVNDINMVSSLLPYCDAMLVDKEIYNILNFPEMKKIIAEYNTKIFSKNQKNELFTYLDNIEKEMPESQSKAIKELHGDDYPIPFLKMYQ